MDKILSWYREFLLPAVLLSALIIGAGMFALPYLFDQAGFISGLFWLALLTVVVSTVHLMYLDVTNYTEGRHRFVGYARIYLGNWGFFISFITTALGNILGLLIYIILAVSLIKVILPNLNDFIALIIFWLFSTAAFVAGIRRMANIEFWGTVGTVIVVFAIFLGGVGGFDAGAVKLIDFNNFLIPYGAILFSLGGRAAISSIKTYISENNLSSKHLNKAVIVGTVIPAILYLLFIIGIIGLSGGSVSENAVAGLYTISPLLIYTIALLGVFELWTSYIFLGLEAKEILSYDLSVSRFFASAIVMFLPIVLYIIGFNNFIVAVGIAGGIFIAIEGIFVISMWLRLRSRSGLALNMARIMVVMFILGGLQELLY